MTVATIPHVVIDDKGVARVAGSRIRVIDIAMEHVGQRWSADEIHRQHSHLTLGQIHAALAYYFDHREEIERSITEGLALVEEMRKRNPSLVKQKLEQLQETAATLEKTLAEGNGTASPGVTTS